MEEHKIMELLQAGDSLTTEEQQLLEDWYNRFAEYRELTFTSPVEKDRIRQEINTAIFRSIHEVPPSQSKKRPIFRWVRIAAAAALIITAGIWGLGYRNYNTPGPASVVSYVDVVAPAGKQNKKVTLPDGSTVWLLAGTTLRFPETFPEEKRDVALVNGTAFFTVTHKPESPFTVTAPGGVRTTVLGTSFTITAYRESDDVTVSVLGGKVNVCGPLGDLGNIRPDQQIVYTKSSAESMQQNINAAPLVDWIEGDIAFHDADMNEVAEVLGSVYQVKLIYAKSATAGLRFNFRFSKKSPLTTSLDIVKNLSEMNYQLRGDTVIISKKTNRP